jgi:uncharacterized cupredoxin-like copper-binding protein
MASGHSGSIRVSTNSHPGTESDGRLSEVHQRTFLLTNQGTVVHEFAVGPSDKVDADQIDGKLVVEADEIEGHHVKTVTYTFAGAGPFDFACHAPGHFEAGMRGAIGLK